ncbi:hypothetical protein [uncultured Aquimarina sp.]|uniref:hypothetical protein n=1 Tax=uncultured Aquimarina sp. TaxID=575652 RepID=UPI00261D1FE8|nr:hypothetical protein [uncultured Aquimarina sp.]
MKKIIYGVVFLAIVGIAFISCDKEEVTEMNSISNDEVVSIGDNNSEIGKNYNFSRDLTVKDIRGNEVDLVIFANTRENAKSLNNESFEIVLNNAEEVEKNIISNPIQAKVLEENLENSIENSVLVYIKDKRFIDNVSSFAIYPSAFENEEKASSGNFKNYAYAAAGVIGATVTYTSETQSKEYLELDIKKKNGTYGIWSRLLGTKLYNVGNSATYCGSTVYHTMMIKVNFHKIKTGKCCYGYSYSFKTSC